jgi:hypothetical protein
MAMQLAWYRSRKTFTATYETALTRMFNKGRTETIRTFTNESRAFVLAMNDPEVSVRPRSNASTYTWRLLHQDTSLKATLFRRAVEKHVSLSREAATGRGIDRHLLGLRMVLKDGENAELFEHSLFSRSQTWRLSTSGLSAGYLFRGTGFVSFYLYDWKMSLIWMRQLWCCIWGWLRHKLLVVVAIHHWCWTLATDLAAPNMIKFGIESKHPSLITSTSQFKKDIAQALTSLHDLVTHAHQREVAKGHLWTLQAQFGYRIYDMVVPVA